MTEYTTSLVYTRTGVHKDIIVDYDSDIDTFVRLEIIDISSSRSNI